MLSCCQRKGLEYCYLCEEFPCKKYDGADKSDSFITHKNQLRDLEKVQRIGLEAYQAELNGKVEVLGHLLKNYNDGRRKSFFCVAVNLLKLADVRTVMDKLSDEAAPDAAQKEKAQAAASLFLSMAECRNISLQLRKKSKAQ